VALQAPMTATDPAPQPHSPTHAAPTIAGDVRPVRVEDLGDHCLVSVCGEIDMATAPMLEHELLRIEANDSRPIVVDLRQVTFMDLSGLRVLLAASNRSWADSHRLRVVRGPGTVQLLFELTDTEQLLPLIDSGAMGPH
jgi:anti-anti-sigma factor